LEKKKVLVAVLNWGLGHATRCVTIVKELERHGCDVVLASDGISLDLLKKEFPLLKSMALPSYNVSYSRHLPMALSICLQLPGVLANIKKEKRFLEGIQKTELFDIVISDCRFGCRIDGIKNIYVTHQIVIKFPAVLKAFEGLGAFFHRLVWSKFDKVWVVDRRGDQALSGIMGHSVEDKKLAYIGICSRFTSPTPRVKTVDVCFLLSGPEPQRTLLEKKIIRYDWPGNKKYHLVRGLPEAKTTLALSPDWKVSNHLSTGELQNVLLSSKLILCRSGYSTVMDMARLGLRPLFIPTPGQPEQEYLAAHLHAKFGIEFRNQKSPDFSSLPINESLRPFGPYDEKEDEELLDEAIEKLI
jgi:hypothetical protein